MSKYDLMTVAEGAGNSYEDAHNMVDADRHELDMAYAFDGISAAKSNGYSLLDFKQVFTKWDSVFADKGWLSIFLANHDQARLVSRFGNDSPEFREASSKMLSTFLLTMRGTPYYYNGDELGMSNAGFTKISDFRDMATLNEYKHQKASGADTAKYLKEIEFSSRDNSRTPFQWDNTPNAGFTTGIPWIKINPNYTTINVAAEEKDPNSCLNYFRKLTKLRKDNLALVYGKYTLLDKDNSNVYAYTRALDGKTMLILLNFTGQTAPVNSGFVNGKLLLDNYGDKQTKSAVKGELRAYEAVVYEVE
jgi:oligo-1,6-glucosidase